VRLTLKRAFADGTVAVDLDPLSLLCRLAAAVPATRFNTIRYAGVLAANAKLRSRVVHKPPDRSQKTPKTLDPPAAEAPLPDENTPRRRYRPCHELLKRTFSVDVLACDKCRHGSYTDGTRDRTHR
jgi:hypothetical protein